MATRDLRVGVVSDSASLVVALSLQGHGLQVAQVNHDFETDSFDVVVVDVPAGEDVQSHLTGRVGDHPHCVVLAADVVDVDGVRVVPRPYSMTQLVDAIHEAANGAHLVGAASTMIEVIDLVADGEVTAASRELEGAPTAVAPAATSIGPNLFAARPAPSAREVPIPTPTANDSEVRTPAPAESPDPITEIVAGARALTRQLKEAPFLRTRRRFAAALAAAIAAELDVSTVVLWSRANGVVEVLGSAGLTEAEQHMTPDARHPLFIAAARDDGVVIDNVGGPDARLLGIPGTRTAAVAAFPVQDPNMPLEAIVVGGQAFLPDLAIRVRDLLAESRAGWEAVASVEALHHEMTH